MVISTEKNSDDENAEENKMRSEQTQAVSEYPSGFTGKYEINATWVKTVVFPTQASALSVSALTGMSVKGWGKKPFQWGPDLNNTQQSTPGGLNI